jgi:hypothetical protein
MISLILMDESTMLVKEVSGIRLATQAPLSWVVVPGVVVVGVVKPDTMDALELDAPEEPAFELDAPEEPEDEAKEGVSRMLKCEGTGVFG